MKLWPNSQLPVDTWNHITLPVQCEVVTTVTSCVHIYKKKPWCLCTFWYFRKVQKWNTPTEEEKWRFHLLPWWPQWILFCFTVERAEKHSVTIVYLSMLTASQIACAVLSSLELGIPPPRDRWRWRIALSPSPGLASDKFGFQAKAELTLAFSLQHSCLFKGLLASKACAKEVNEMVQILFRTRSRGDPLWNIMRSCLSWIKEFSVKVRDSWALLWEKSSLQIFCECYPESCVKP